MRGISNGLCRTRPEGEDAIKMAGTSGRQVQRLTSEDAALTADGDNKKKAKHLQDLRNQNVRLLKDKEALASELALATSVLEAVGVIQKEESAVGGAATTAARRGRQQVKGRCGRLFVLSKFKQSEGQDVGMPCLVYKGCFEIVDVCQEHVPYVLSADWFNHISSRRWCGPVSRYWIWLRQFSCHTPGDEGVHCFRMDRWRYHAQIQSRNIEKVRSRTLLQTAESHDQFRNHGWHWLSRATAFVKTHRARQALPLTAKRSVDSFTLAVVPPTPLAVGFPICAVVAITAAG